MDNKLKLKETIFIGSMLFGLFFGAGNLIFPVNMGQNAGSSVGLANIGFILTAVGLPFLGVLAMGVTGVGGVHELASKVDRRYAGVFTALLYLSISIFFAAPRLATTSFTIGVAPFVSKNNQQVALAIFSFVFYTLAWLLARNSAKILVVVGKFLNPIFLILLSSLLVMVFLKPLGVLNGVKVQPNYELSPFFEGFKAGYNTLDALAALAFGIVVISTIRQLGVKTKTAVAKEVLKSGIVVIILMSVIYTALTYAGVLSLGKFSLSENGGIALAELANYYLGLPGAILLAFIVTIACLKTAVGLITAFSEATEEMLPSVSYKKASILAAVLPAIFANVGLSAIISIAVPVLMFLYPLAMTLILLALLEQVIGYKKEVYVWVTIFTSVTALFDALNAATALKEVEFVKGILSIAKHLPFFDMGMGWIVPSIVGLFIGLAHAQLSPTGKTVKE